MNERRKLAPTLENHTGSWRLFNGLAGQSSRVQFSLVHTGYADNLKFIKNQPHKDSLKTPLKLANKLATKEINQMVNFYAF